MWEKEVRHVGIKGVHELLVTMIVTTELSVQSQCSLHFNCFRDTSQLYCIPFIRLIYGNTR